MTNFEEFGFKAISRQQWEKDEVSKLIPYEEIKLPKRATAGSAGYDFYSLQDFELNPGEEVKIPTGIRCIIPEGYFLMIVPRSGIGFKYGVRLKNSAGVIDSDYSNSTNEGHIWVKLDYPELSKVEQKPLQIEKGEAICQGIILPYATFNNEDKDFQIRDGGFGSTSR